MTRRLAYRAVSLSSPRCLGVMRLCEGKPAFLSKAASPRLARSLVASRAVGVRVLCTHRSRGETCPVVMARTPQGAVHKTPGLVGRGLVHGASLVRRVVKTRTPQGAVHKTPGLVGRGLVHTERASRTPNPSPALSAASHGAWIPKGKRMFSRRNLRQTVTGALSKTGARGSVFELHPRVFSRRSLHRVTWGGFGGKASGFSPEPAPALAGLSV